MRDMVKELLARYRERLSGRLGTALEGSWNAFLPFFTDHVLETVRTKISTTTAEHHTDDPLLYPEGTKYLYRFRKSCFIVVEQKPQVRTMHFLTQGEKRLECANRVSYRLAFPYVVFVIGLCQSEEAHNMEASWQLSHAFCGFSNRAVKSLHDTIYHPNVPNIHQFQVCVGPGYPNYPASIADSVDRLVSHFWQGQFSKDWADDFEEYRRTHTCFSTLEAWEEASIKNPLFPTKIAWEDGKKINELLAVLAIKSKGEPFSVIESFSRQVVAEAAKKARLDVANAFEGVEVESLDDKFCDELNNNLAGRAVQ